MYLAVDPIATATPAAIADEPYILTKHQNDNRVNNKVI